MLGDGPVAACLPALVEAAAHDPAVARFFHRYAQERRGVLVGVLAAGVAAGELPAGLDPEFASLALIGPIVYRRLLTAEPFDPTQVPLLASRCSALRSHGRL